MVAPALAQNLLANGDFDANLNGWFNPEPPAPSWDALDAQGSATSGSVRVLNNDFAPSMRVALTQCIVPPRPGNYRLTASGYIPQQLSSGRLQVVYEVMIGANCESGGLSSGGMVVENIGAWSRFSSVPDFPVPGDVPTSIRVTLLTEKVSGGGAFVGHFDDASLTYIDTLYADGFEDAEASP
jgi:hypothetical protein